MRVQALYAIDDQVVGFASRTIEVRATGAAAAAEPAAGVAVGVPAGERAPDITISVLYSGASGDGRMTWKVLSPISTVPVPACASDIGDDAKGLAARLVREMAADTDGARTARRLRGLGREVAASVPAAVWQALRDVAAAVPGRPPTCLLLSEEPYVPWELASVRPPLDPAAPEHLSTQAIVGRWLLHDGSSPPPPHPPHALDVRDLAVVTGEDQGLPQALEEADYLADRFRAHRVPARERDVMTLLEDGVPAADAVHFAVHGRYDPGGFDAGLQLEGLGRLTDLDVRGITLASARLVFLNACEVGSAELMLGRYGGLAISFLRSGAAAVIAPLWAVDDQYSRGVAERFYAKVLDEGARPAEVLMHQRRRIADQDAPTPTPLAYQFFGHPDLRVRRVAS